MRAPSALSPLVLALVATVVATAAIVLSSTTNAGGRLVLPLDDAYIYLQYAAQNADGEWFRYNDGDPATTGATSLLYVLVLTPFAWLFSGDALAGVALLLGALFYGLTLTSVHRLATTWLGASWGTPALLLVALAGPFLWGSFSGMEIALVAWLSCQAVRALARLDGAPDNVGARRGVTVWLSLFALSRPEAAVLTVGIVGLTVVLRRRPTAVGLPTVGVPLVVAGLPFLLNLVLTGDPGSTALASKAAPRLPGTTLTSWILTSTEFFLRSLKGLFASGDTAFAGWPNAYTSLVTFASPLALFFAAVGVFPSARREIARRRPAAGLASLVLVGGALAIWSALVPIHLHWSRYAMPYVPLIVVWILLGVKRVGSRLDDESDGAVGSGLTWFFGATHAVTALFFVAAFGWNAREIRDQHIAFAEWMNDNLPAGRPLATNDVGALRYFGTRDVVDLHGLTTRRFAEAKQVGTGAVFEALERMPRGDRPSYVAVIPHWFDPEFFKILQPLRSQTLNQASISGSPLVLYRADWTGIGSADEPMVRTRDGVRGRRVSDRLDVADLESEAEHGYSAALRPGGHASPLGVFRDPDDGRPLVDGARRITDHERFRLSATPGRPGTLVVRCLGRLRADLVLSGESTVPLRGEPGGEERWTEVSVPIPASALASGHLDVRIEAFDGGLQEGGYLPAHYWLYQ